MNAKNTDSSKLDDKQKSNLIAKLASNPWQWLKTRIALITLALLVTSLFSISIYASKIMREEIQRILTNPHLTFLSNTSSILDASVNTLQQHLLLATLLLSFFVAPLIGWLIKRQFEPLQLVCSELSKQMAINQIAIQRPEIQDEISDFIVGFNQLLDTSHKKDNLINESYYL